MTFSLSFLVSFLERFLVAFVKVLKVGFPSPSPDLLNFEIKTRNPNVFMVNNMLLIVWHLRISSTTLDSGNSKRLNSKQSLISKHFW